jgi:hypothetical protein
MLPQSKTRHKASEPFISWSLAKRGMAYFSVKGHAGKGIE